MLERIIELKRNSFFVFMLRFLPIIFWGGVVSVWAYNAFSSDISKCLSFISFVIALLFGLKDLKNNRKCLSISENGISIGILKKGKLVIEKFLPAEDIMFVKCDERLKNIYVTMKDVKRYELLKYNSAHMLGADKFFFVKAELCRFFPSFAHECIDDEVKGYIEAGTISEFLKNKVETARAQAAVLFVAELVFAAIPLGLSVIAVAWVVVKIIYHLMLVILYFVEGLR
jgi:hypothetical protein